MFFKKNKKRDEDVEFLEWEAELFRLRGDDESTVRQKIDASRARRQATRDAQKAEIVALQAHYDAIAAQARAAGDDFLTVKWKLGIARAEHSRRANADFNREDRKRKIAHLAFIREYLKNCKPVRVLEQEQKKRLEAEVRETYVPAEEQPDQYVNESYRKAVRDAGIMWFLKTAGVRIFTALTVGVFLGLLLQLMLEWGTFTSASVFAPALTAVAMLAMPVERYMTGAWVWVKLHKADDKLIMAMIPFGIASFAIQTGPRETLFHAIGLTMLALCCVVVAMEAKGLGDIGWEGLRSALKALPSGAILFLLSVAAATVVAAGSRRLLSAYPELSTERATQVLTVCIGASVLAMWWLWIRWWKPSSRCRSSLSVPGLIGGAAEGVMRGRMALIGAWWTLVGGIILWWSVPSLISALMDPAAGMTDRVLAGIGTAVGAYWFFGRGLGPIATAFKWSRSLPDQAVHGDARLATPDEAKKAARAGPGSSPPIDPGTLNY